MAPKFLSQYFRLAENKTDIKTEFIAGTTTFMTMAYIIFVNPSILTAAMGADKFPAVMAATCIASAAATFIMALAARYPIALAPGMGLNAFFAYSVCLGMKVPWQTALGIVFISGLFFTLLTLVKIREMIIDAIPPSLKIAVAVGIGLFIAFIGLKEGGIVASHPVTYVKLGDLSSKPVLVSIFGLLLTVGLIARRVKGSLLWGILGSGIMGLLLGVVEYRGIFGFPSIKPVFGQLRIFDALQVKYLAPLLVLLFVDMFDTIGTLIGVGEKAGLLKEGKLKRATPALLSDSLGTMIGSICGTSTVTSYIESSAGVSEGGKTGLSSIFTACLFLIALFFTPLAEMLGGGYKVEPGVYLHPVTSPALVVVGFLMISCIRKIEWDNYTESIPAFLTIIIMPLTFSISHGLALGFISYALLKLISGRVREISWMVYLLAAIFLGGYIFLPGLT